MRRERLPIGSRPDPAATRSRMKLGGTEGGLRPSCLPAVCLARLPVRRPSRNDGARRHAVGDPVRVKIAFAPDGMRNVAPEYEDCKRVALAHGVPLKLDLQAALAAASRG